MAIAPEWWSDENIRNQIDDIICDLDSKFCLLVPQLVEHKQNTNEWKLFLATAAFIDRYAQARHKMGFTIDESFAIATNYVLNLPFVQSLIVAFATDSIDALHKQMGFEE